MGLKTRVIDGVRTRDNRNHNPQANSEFQALSFSERAYERDETHSKSRVGVPGPETELPAWLGEARTHLREHYPHDGLSESVLWTLYAAGFGIADTSEI